MTRSILCTAALLAFAGGARTATAQADTTARPDTAAPAPPDTTAAYLPIFAPARPAGPLPAGTRYSFTADSFALSSIQTLSDLLGRIPGVYVARGGIYGQPEIVFYGGRGAAGLEIYWDGMPYLPLGRDSVFLDPARISLAPLERVDVVVLPATLRVYLVTARQQSTVPATQIRIATGEVSTGNYRGYYAKRWRSGLGLSLLADYNNNDGIPNSASGAFNSVDLWLNAQWLPSPRLGVSYQLLNSTWKRSPSDAGLSDKFEYQRREALLRAFVAARRDGLGPRAELLFATATAERDTAVPRRSLSQGALALSHDWRRAHFGITLRAQGDERPWQVEATAAWCPIAPLTLAADARRARYDGSRKGDRVHLAAGLALPLGVSIHGDATWAKDLQAPSLASDTGQETVDVSGALRWQRGRTTLEVGGGRRDPFTPLGRAAGLKPIGGLSRTQRTRYFTGHAALQPVPGLHLAGWYFHPLVTSGNDFEPPHHARVSATFYSKFWRVYRSGIFALRGEVAVESWSRGTAGLDGTGNLQPLRGATFMELNVEVQVAGVTIYWIQRNANRTRGNYVPGLNYPSQFQFYGVRWLFTD